MDRGHGRVFSCALKARAWVPGEEDTEVVLLAGETSLWHRSTTARSTDSAAVTHEFCDELRAARVNFLTGYDLTETVRSAILALPEAAWRAASGQDGERRNGAWVAEITEQLALAGWPAGTRVIVRRERPHPGAQLSFTDHNGHRFLPP